MEKTNEGFGQKINKIAKAIRRRRRIRRRNALKAGKLTFSMKLKKAFRKISGLFMGLKPWARAAACAMLALPVSYTHLTLPTRSTVYISVVAV